MSPDTPSVCPHCGSEDVGDAASGDGYVCYRCSHAFDPPAAPGSSSPDTAALVAELRAESEYVRLRNGETVTMLDRAADALEAQAARITELEAAIRAALHRATLRNEPDPELEDVLNGDSDA